jgi:hypothetical protein
MRSQLLQVRLVTSIWTEFICDIQASMSGMSATAYEFPWQNPELCASYKGEDNRW